MRSYGWLARAAALLGAVVACSGAALGQTEYSWEPEQRAVSLDFRVLDKGGKELPLAQLVTRPTLINFWATWCAPCLLELPALDRFARDAKGRGLAVVAVAIDGEGWQEVEPILRKLRVRHLGAVVFPGQGLDVELGLAGMPTSFLVGADGKVTARRRGRVDWDAPEERAAVLRLLQ